MSECSRISHTGAVVDATAKNGIEAVECQLALRQVEALTALGTGEGKQTLILSKNLMKPL